MKTIKTIAVAAALVAAGACLAAETVPGTASRAAGEPTNATTASADPLPQSLGLVEFLSLVRSRHPVLRAMPLRQGMEPGYEQKRFTNAEKTNILRLVASPDGAENSVQLNADARIYATLMDGSTALHQALDAQRKAYVFVVSGAVSINGQKLTSGDAALIENESSLTLDQASQAEVLVFDLAA